jgi:hypothetical protein
VGLAAAVTREETLAEWTRRLDSAILDARIGLATRTVTGERRRLLQEELLELRLCRAGVETKHTRAYLKRLGISASKRPPVLRRGPREWGAATRVTLR